MKYLVYGAYFIVKTTCEVVYDIADDVFSPVIWLVCNAETEFYLFWRDWFYNTSPHCILAVAAPAFVIAGALFGIDFIAKYFKLYDLSIWDSWFSRWLPTWLYKPKSYRNPEHERLLKHWQAFQAKRDNLEFGQRADKIAEIKRLEKEIADFATRCPSEIFGEVKELGVKARESLLRAFFDHHPAFLIGGLFCAWFRVNNGLKLLYGHDAGLQLADYVTGHLHELGRWLARTVKTLPRAVGLQPNDVSLTRIAENPQSHNGEPLGVLPTIVTSDGDLDWLGLSDRDSIFSRPIFTPNFKTWRIKSIRGARRHRLPLVDLPLPKTKKLKPKRWQTRLITWLEVDKRVEEVEEINQLARRKKISPREYCSPRFPQGGSLPYSTFQYKDYGACGVEVVRPFHRSYRKIYPGVGKYSDCNTWAWDSSKKISVPDPLGHYKPEVGSPCVYAFNTIIWGFGLALNIYFYYNEFFYPLLLRLFY